MNPEHVWREVSYKDDINYQPLANEQGMIDGKLVHKKAYLDYVPINGYYKYKTNPQQLGEWILSGEIFIHRVLSDEEVCQILIGEGYEHMPRKGGDIDLSEYGF